MTRLPAAAATSAALAAFAWMREMDMTPPRQFTQVESALEADLQRIPAMSDAELQSLLPQHLDRVQTVISMRQDMMDEMM